MYACPDYSCNAYPGVLHVIMSGGRIFGYFKDSKDNQYYQGEALLTDFMTLGPDVMSFKEVQNGAGESEIIAAAASLKADLFAEVDVDRLSSFDYDADSNELTIDFDLPLSEVVSIPAITIVHDATGVGVGVESSARVAGSSSAVVYTLESEALTKTGPATVTLADGFFFVKNSAERYGWDNSRKIVLAGTEEVGSAPSINLINGVLPSTSGINLVTILEEQSSAFTVEAADVDGDEITYRLSGPDADLLQVDEDGEVTFIAAPDYEVPSDSDANGTYIAILTASDGENESTIAVEIVVINGTDTVSGVLIDGYVAGSVVFQDVNANGVLDEDEPSTITDVLGNFSLELASFAADARIRVIDSGFDIGSNTTLGAMLDINPNGTGRLVMTPASTVAARMMSYQPLLSKGDSEYLLSTALGLELAALPNSSLFGYDPIALLRNATGATGLQARAVLAANQALMANGNAVGAATVDIVESAVSDIESEMQDLITSAGGSGSVTLSALELDQLQSVGHSAYMDAVTEQVSLGKPRANALRLDYSGVQVVDYIDGSVANTHYLYPSVDAGTGALDISVPAPLDLSNLYDLVGSEQNGTAPAIRFTLNSIPDAGRVVRR